VLTEDDFVLAEELLFGLRALQLLDCKLVLKELFSSLLKSLLFNQTWCIVLLENAAWNEDIVVDLVVIGCVIVGTQQEAIEVVLIFLLGGLSGDCGAEVHVDDAGLFVLLSEAICTRLVSHS